MPDDKENSTYPEIYQRLVRLCEERRSGTLFLTTPDNHAARITLAQGEIIACNYRVKRGVDALERIRSIEVARYQFAEGDITTQPDPSLPQNVELLEILRPLAMEQIDAEAGAEGASVEESAAVEAVPSPSGVSRLVFEELRKVVGPVAVELFRVEIQNRGEPETGEELRALVKALAGRIGDADQAKEFIAGIRQRLS